VGSEGIRASASLVPKAERDALSNEKLRPVDSGRGLALLEKMGWKKGQGLGRHGTGTMLPVSADIKTDMGGLRVDGEESVRGGAARDLGAEEGLGDHAFSVNAAQILAQVQGRQAASMDSEFSSITSQTKSVQQINEENRRAAATGGAPAPGGATSSLPPPVSSMAAPPPPPAAAPPPAPPPHVPPPHMPPPHMPYPTHAPPMPMPGYPPPPGYPGYPPPPMQYMPPPAPYAPPYHAYPPPYGAPPPYPGWGGY